MKRASRTRTSSLFEKILSQYKTAWEKRDPDLAVELFTANATYQEDPFHSRPLRGRKEIYAYWAEVPRYQRNISFTYGPIFQLVGSNVWGAEWAAKYTKARSGGRMRLKGVLFCRLSGGKISAFWEYWHHRGGAPSFSADSLRTGKTARKS